MKRSVYSGSLTLTLDKYHGCNTSISSRYTLTEPRVDAVQIRWFRGPYHRRWWGLSMDWEA